MNLYLKYRPKQIDELDLKEVREFLSKLASQGKLSHAYLFDGPRGAGKTSAARILAKMVNCEACDRVVCAGCGQCQSCRLIEEGKAVDLIEIDGASNRRIDDVRELKDRIRLAPTRLRKKVYIIDEVHMLTTEAFNALLKTLEEPPSHAVFVLATTEFHKLPETIVSRCVRLRFRKATKEEMLRALKRVIKGEGMEVTEAALELLAESVDGSFRDGVKVLEQVLAEDQPVGVEVMRRVLQGSKQDYSRELASLVLQGELLKAIELVREFGSGGGSFEFLLKQTMKKIKEEILAGYGVGEPGLGVKVGVEGVGIIRKMDETLRLLGGVTDDELLVELMLLELLGKRGESQKQGGNKSNEEDKEVREEEEEEEKEEKGEVRKATGVAELQARWSKVQQMAGKHYSLGALLSEAWVMGQDERGNLIVGVRYEFHKRQLETERFRREAESLVAKVVGFPVGLRFKVVKGEVGAELKTDLNGNGVEDEGEELVKVAEEIFL